MLLMMFVIFSCPKVCGHDLSRFKVFANLCCLPHFPHRERGCTGIPFGVNYFPAEHNLPVVAAAITTMFLPGSQLGIASCWHRDIVKTVIAHPSVVLMPDFTFFTFSSRMKCHNSAEDEDEDKSK